MFRCFLVLLLSFNFTFSSENIVKTSELELFLFKVGFESLLKDLDVTKKKSSSNDSEIKNINEKIELIMSELYKDKRVLLNNLKEDTSTNSISNKEFENLKSEILFLKEEIRKLKQIDKKEEITLVKNESIIKTVRKGIQKRVVSNIVNIYSSSFDESIILRKIKRNNIILIESCDKYGWCKLLDKNEYIKKFLLK